MVSQRVWGWEVISVKELCCYQYQFCYLLWFNNSDVVLGKAMLWSDVFIFEIDIALKIPLSDQCHCYSVISKPSKGVGVQTR